METGFGRNLLAELLDSVGRGVLLMALGIGWFVFLWGLNLPALLAGIALGTLLLLLRRLYRQTTLVRRETALRCRIGGELLLEKMLLSEAKEAHFQAALLLEEKWPLRMQRITADGALCGQEKPSGGAETLLVQCVRMPSEGELSIGQLVEAHRAMQRQQANRVILCVLGKAPPRVIARPRRTMCAITVSSRLQSCVEIFFKANGEFFSALIEDFCVGVQHKFGRSVSRVPLHQFDIAVIEGEFIGDA